MTRDGTTCQKNGGCGKNKSTVTWSRSRLGEIELSWPPSLGKLRTLVRGPQEKSKERCSNPVCGIGQDEIKENIRTINEKLDNKVSNDGDWGPIDEDQLELVDELLSDARDSLQEQIKYDEVSGPELVAAEHKWNNTVGKELEHLQENLAASKNATREARRERERGPGDVPTPGTSGEIENSKINDIEEIIDKGGVVGREINEAISESAQRSLDGPDESMGEGASESRTNQY